jgi:hypothetical protein
VYGIPKDFDPTIFVGAMLERLSFGPYIVTLDFGVEGGLALSIEGSYEHSGPADGGWHDVDEPPVSDSRLTRLAGKIVEAAVVEDSRTLRLSFDDGQTLRVKDDSSQYESFQVSHGQKYWVI